MSAPSVSWNSTSRHRDARSVVRAADLPTVAVVGLGYVGLPTALGLHDAGAPVIGARRQPRAGSRRSASGGSTSLRRRPRPPAERRSTATAFPLTDRRRGASPTPTPSSSACRRPSTSTSCPDLATAARRLRRPSSRTPRPARSLVLTSTTYVGCTRDLLVAPLARARAQSPATTSSSRSRPSASTRATTAHPQERVPRVVGGVDRRVRAARGRACSAASRRPCTSSRRPRRPS